MRRIDLILLAMTVPMLALAVALWQLSRLHAPGKAPPQMVTAQAAMARQGWCMWSGSLHRPMAFPAHSDNIAAKTKSQEVTLNGTTGSFQRLGTGRRAL